MYAVPYITFQLGQLCKNLGVRMWGGLIFKWNTFINEEIHVYYTVCKLYLSSSKVMDEILSFNVVS